MAADVLAHEVNSAAWNRPCRSMHAASARIQRLQGFKLNESGVQIFDRNGCSLCNLCNGPHRLLERFRAAQATAGAPREIAPPLEQLGKALRSNSNANFDGIRAVHDFN